MRICFFGNLYDCSPFNRFIDFSASILVGEGTAEPFGEFVALIGEEGEAGEAVLPPVGGIAVVDAERLAGAPLRGSLLMRLLKKSANTLCSFCC